MWRRLITPALVVGALAAGWLVRDVQWSVPGVPDAVGLEVVDPSNADIHRAFETRSRGRWVDGRGTVVRILSDDTEGDRHQRWILDLGRDHTLLVAHNIDLAPRVPIEPGDEVDLRGRYEWNERGGVVHWTHHDPRDPLAGGWVKHQGRTYR